MGLGRREKETDEPAMRPLEADERARVQQANQACADEFFEYCEAFVQDASEHLPKLQEVSYKSAHTDEQIRSLLAAADLVIDASTSASTSARAECRKKAKMADPADAQTVVCFGDSNTWGYDPATGERIPHGKRWTCLLQTLLGSQYRVISEGLNARTTVFDDPIAPCGGDYSCNGREYLKPCLHSHKPVDLVVLALGTNDLKTYFSTSPQTVTAGLRVLIQDILRSTDAGPRPGVAPRVLLMIPPMLHETPTSLEWSFEGCQERSAALVPLYQQAAVDLKVSVLDSNPYGAVSPLDGIHFTLECQQDLAAALAAAVPLALSGLAPLPESRVGMK